jgi:hypothetical protein
MRNSHEHPMSEEEKQQRIEIAARLAAEAQRNVADPELEVTLQALGALGDAHATHWLEQHTGELDAKDIRSHGGRK